ncbi:PD-(D/E)XK nuclease domain-containing protein [Leadbettera azotonutricia]|uniref:PD-(D/E)XK nuclease domain-containing protein n=1 Tax=Leadbettera azotonutricia TaxID=150829 RepID=UPI0002D5F249|nr:PD-(D/E)XK nuclease domain-containing protein [Leadbettera azotonutricia]
MWESKLNYPEAFPHLLLMAFLQRVTNGSGRIEREYAAGRGRMDIAVEYHGQWNIIEIKLVKPGRSFEAVQEDGIKQTLGYRDRFSPNSKTPVHCYLVIFDRRYATPGQEKPAWKERLKWMVKDGITVVGC